MTVTLSLPMLLILAAGATLTGFVFGIMAVSWPADDHPADGAEEYRPLLPPAGQRELLRRADIAHHAYTVTREMDQWDAERRIPYQ